jgi:hypothetical protein
MGYKYAVSTEQASNGFYHAADDDDDDDEVTRPFQISIFLRKKK